MTQGEKKQVGNCRYGSINIVNFEEEDCREEHHTKFYFVARTGLFSLIFLCAIIISAWTKNWHDTKLTPDLNLRLHPKEQQKMLLGLAPPLPCPLTRGCEKFYNEQIVDHFGQSTETWSQRFFSSSEHWSGPGSPMFLIVGGEDDDMTGFYYPFIAQHLAKMFRAYVLQPEHRFYGQSQPVANVWDNEGLAELLTPEQAIADFVNLALHIQDTELGCSRDRSSSHYCPLMVVGGSYPARLAVMMRLAYPDVVDIAYAGSSPLLGLLGLVDSSQYYDHITNVAEKSSPGCAQSVKHTLLHAIELARSEGSTQEDASFETIAQLMGLCIDTIPAYIKNNKLFLEEVMMLVGNIFAEYNMDFYPPNNDTNFVKACKTFQDSTLTAFEKLESFFLLYAIENDYGRNTTGKANVCFDLMTHVPEGGNHPTISSSDWSGAGGGNAGSVWDFQLCYDLVTPLGFSDQSMFPRRDWTIEWLTNHCWRRFKLVPQPRHLLDEFGFDELVERGASQILFTNGANDGWAAYGSILHDLSETIVVVNFPNGAHHSDLSYKGPDSEATEDLIKGRIQISQLLSKWFDNIKNHN